MKLLASLAVLSLLAGCAAPRVPLATPSGRPEVVISGVTKKQVADKIVDRMAARGLTLRTVSDYQIVAGKRSDDVSTNVFFGSRYDSTPEYRISYTMVEQPPNVRVYATVAIVTNPGSGFEKVNDFTEQQGQNLQTMLSGLRAELEAAPK